MRRFRFARTKNELSTKFVVGLGRVRENFVVYWREIGRNEKVWREAECEGARRLWI